MASKKTRRRRGAALAAKPTVLAIDSNFEPITKAGHDYRNDFVYPYLEGRGFPLIRCQGPLARRIYVAVEDRRPGVLYFTGVGHGLPDTYTGDYFDPVFRVGSYDADEAREKIVHFLSCETAQQLGPDFVEKGCRAYFGYDENFTFQMDAAAIFFECDSEIDRAFADGLKAGQVYARTRALYDRRIAEFRANGQDYKAATLEFDRDHLRCPTSGPRWGDKDARLV